MADLELTLSWLGMSQYFERFTDAGFDSWEAMLEITESDLEILNIDLGHRRKLQREIANSKWLARDSALAQPSYNFPTHRQQQEQIQRVEVTSPDSIDQQGGPTKRGYKHHPKPDKNAPERPYSAYVLFSNHTREELKAQKLTFTDLSKTVGEKWQALSSGEKEVWKQNAVGPWEEYKEKVAEYQKTDKYQAYQRYLHEFKATQESRRLAKKESGTRQYPGELKTPSYHPSSKASSQPKQSHPDTSSGSQEGPTVRNSRIAVKRLRREEEKWAGGEDQRSSRATHACERCRRKKLKCYGEQPACRHCNEIGTKCQYDQGKRDTHREEETDNLWQKVKAYEALLLQVIPQVDDHDQQAIQNALLLPPQLERFRKNPEVKIESEQRSEDETEGHGEDSASGIGSMGSTDRVNEHRFVRNEENTQATSAFAGQASDTRWLQKLEGELSGSSPESKDQQAQYSAFPSIMGVNPGPSNKKPKSHLEDMDMSIVGGQLYPFELPLRETADALVRAYFNSVHLSFPILDKTEFMAQYVELYNEMDTATYEDHNFIATAHLVFAIGAVHAHLIEADWAGDPRDHMLFFANARVLAVDSGALNDACYIGQVQVFGLGAVYLLVTDQINRAWNLTGLAIRSAQSMGLHLMNVTPDLNSSGRAFLANVWFAVIALESMLTVMTGRPSMVNKRDCSVSLALDMSDDGESSPEATPSEDSYQTSAQDFGTRASISTSRSSASSRAVRQQPNAPISDIYFKHYTDLCALAKEVVGELYRPGIREKKWAEIQVVIENFDKRLFRWRDALNIPFDVATPSADPEVESCRVALRILFYSTRTIIHRPCLCRLDQHIADQSRSSKATNRGFANKCVDSARSVLDLILNKPESTVLHHGAMWWMILHHLKRALTVLLLELSFRAEHMPADAAGLLDEAKAAVNWLRNIGFSNPTAKHTWITLSRLLHQAAQKVGGNTADIVIAPDDNTAEPQFSIDFGSEGSGNTSGPGQPSEAYDPNDQNIFPPLGLYGGLSQGHGQYFGDLAATSEWDEFGFLGHFLSQQSDQVLGQMTQRMDQQQQKQQQYSSQGQRGAGQRQQVYPTDNEQSQWLDFSGLSDGTSDQQMR